MKIVAALLAFAAAANAEIGADQETQLRAEIAETKAQLAEVGSPLHRLEGSNLRHPTRAPFPLSHPRPLMHADSDRLRKV